VKQFIFGTHLKFEYKNYRGETAMRNVQFRGLAYGSNEYYPEPQWFMVAWCHERQAIRSFALNLINPEGIEIVQHERK
jgi:predicted DNA-binding transcriptional regulator YafY